ncbi:MAG: ABC transporter ATP-binding protein [Thermoplasmataceae archaeon]
MATVEVIEVSKRYGRLLALENINLKMDSNGCVGILGPNGAGKTTLMKIMTNIIKPTSGRVLINGVNVSENPSRALRTVGSIVEQPEFYRYLTARETLMFVCRVKGGSLRYCEDEVARVSKITEVQGFIDRKTGTYSRGMKQRLALAIALINTPDVIILDEPTFGLDPRGMADIRKTLARIRDERQSLIVMSTHLISEVKELCDRVIIINSGNIAYDSVSDTSDRILRVRFYEPLKEGLGKLSLDARIGDDGKTALIRVENNTPNYFVIRKLIERGLKIRDVDESTSIEEKYLSIVGAKEA